MRDPFSVPPGFLPPDYHDAYDETSLWAAHFGMLLLDELELRRGIDGLDVACGTGFPLIELAQQHGPSSRWTGVDTWDAALDRARRKIEILGVENAAVQHGDAHALPFPARSFDCITSNLGINNFDDPPAALREMARVARPGARIAITTNVTGHMREMYALLREAIVDGKLEELLPALDEQERHRGSLESIRAMFEAAGLRVERHAVRTFQLRFADGSAMLRHSLVKWFLDGWRGVIGPERERDFFADVERRLNDRSSQGGIAFTVDALFVEAIKP